MVFVEVQSFGTDTRYGLKKNVVKELKLKVRKVWGLILTFEEVIGEKLVGRPFCHSELG